MTFRPPIIVTIYSLRKVAEPVYNVNVSPLLTPNPAQPFVQSLWESATLGKPKAIGEAFGTDNPLLNPNPSRPFNQYEWRIPAQIPIALKSDSYWGAFSLYSPNPAIPFRQNLWEGAAKAWPKAIGEAQGGDSPLLTPNPAQPFVQTDWNRVCVAGQAIKSDIYVNLLPIQSIVVVSAPFAQTDWPAAFLPRQKVEAKSETPSLSIYFPNPKAPFIQTDWVPPTFRPPQSDRSFIESTSYIPAPSPPVGVTYEWIIRARRRGRR